MLSFLDAMASYPRVYRLTCVTCLNKDKDHLDSAAPSVEAHLQRVGSPSLLRTDAFADFDGVLAQEPLQLFQALQRRLVTIPVADQLVHDLFVVRLQSKCEPVCQPCLRLSPPCPPARISRVDLPDGPGTPRPLRTLSTACRTSQRSLQAAQPHLRLSEGNKN